MRTVVQLGILAFGAYLLFVLMQVLWVFGGLTAVIPAAIGVVLVIAARILRNKPGSPPSAQQLYEAREDER